MYIVQLVSTAPYSQGCLLGIAPSVGMVGGMRNVNSEDWEEGEEPLIDWAQLLSMWSSLQIEAIT